MKIIANLNDDQYPFSYINHIRNVARGVVINGKNEVAFVKLHGHDSFVDRNYFELPGGGVRLNEKIKEAFLREMKEETGYQVTIVHEIGQVRDFYNLIHRENHNYYFLAKTDKWMGTELEEYETKMIEQIVWMPIDRAIEAFHTMLNSGCGLLVKRRELPILIKAKEWLEKQSKIIAN